MPVNVPDSEVQAWKQRITSGLADRKKHEPVWMECLAFSQGNQWVRYAGQYNRRLVTLPNPRNIDRYTIDELTQYRLVLLGELLVDDDRPQALFRQEDAPTADYAEQANDAFTYGWDEEWLGGETLAEAKRTMIDLGTAPIRCRFDPTVGDDAGERPFVDGRLVSTEQAMEAHRQGARVELRNVKTGRIVWEAGTPFNMVVPPKFPREDKFPWEVWVSIHPLEDLRDQYPGRASELYPDPVESVAKLSQPGDMEAGHPQDSDSETGSADGHCFLYTCYERPSARRPEGRVVVLATGRMVALEARDRLPYRGPDGRYRSGIHYLHAIRLTDRFWSRGFVELGLSPARALNKRMTQIEQTIDKGQAKVYLETGSLKRMPEGYPMEVVWLEPGKPKPVIDQGAPPGPWLRDNIELQRENLARVLIPEVALGENPTNVDTYSALALLHEQAKRRLDPIIQQNRGVVVHLSEDAAWDIKHYWGPEKLVAIGGTEGQLRSSRFNASAWPDYTKFMFAKGAAQPRTQGAQLKLVEQLWAAAVDSQAVHADPVAWMTWLYQSTQAGKPLDLPVPPVDAQRAKAQYENDLLAQGMPPQEAISLVDYFDQHELHVMEHRQVQAHARAMGRVDVFVACEAHVKEHERQALLNAMQSMRQAPPQPPMPAGNGGQPGQPAPAPSG
jgi:hypothetical protein